MCESVAAQTQTSLEMIILFSAKIYALLLDHLNITSIIMITIISYQNAVFPKNVLLAYLCLFIIA